MENTVHQAQDAGAGKQLVELSRFYLILAAESNVNIVLSGAEEEWHQLSVAST